jgi:hypothetical protein
MSASTRTIQQPLGTRQMAAALVVVLLAIVIAAAVAVGQLAATKPQTAPAPGSAPVFIDHGSRTEIGTGGALKAPVFVDKETRDATGTAGAGSGGNGTRLPR